MSLDRRLDDKRCKNCMWYAEDRCHWNPPIAFREFQRYWNKPGSEQGEVVDVVGFPKVKPDDFCSNFTKKLKDSDDNPTT